MPKESVTQRAAEEARLAVTEGRHFVRQDRYVLVLVLIILTILSSAMLGEGALGLEVSLGFLLATLLVTLSTSDAGPRLRWTGGVTAVFTIVVVFAAESLGYAGLARFAYEIAMAVLAVVTPAVIAQRIARHPTVNLDTVAGAADIYLLVGLLFSVLFGLVGAAHAGQMHMLLSHGTQADAAKAFFVASRPTTQADFIYYSFVTLTTVGYGDLTSAFVGGRMLSVVEALFGQLYLVTIVALIVANIGRTRQVKHPDGSVDRVESGG